MTLHINTERHGWRLKAKEKPTGKSNNYKVHLQCLACGSSRTAYYSAWHQNRIACQVCKQKLADTAEEKEGVIVRSQHITIAHKAGTDDFLAFQGKPIDAVPQMGHEYWRDAAAGLWQFYTARLGEKKLVRSDVDVVRTLATLGLDLFASVDNLQTNLADQELMRRLMAENEAFKAHAPAEVIAKVQEAVEAPEPANPLAKLAEQGDTPPARTEFLKLKKSDAHWLLDVDGDKGTKQPPRDLMLWAENHPDWMDYTYTQGLCSDTHFYIYWTPRPKQSTFVRPATVEVNMFDEQPVESLEDRAERVSRLYDASYKQWLHYKETAGEMGMDVPDEPTKPYNYKEAQHASTD